MRVLALADKFASLLHDLPLLNERSLLMTEVNLQPQTVLNDGTNFGVDDLLVLAVLVLDRHRWHE